MTNEEAKARVLEMCNTKTDDDLFCPVCAAKVGWRSVKFSKQVISEYCDSCGQHIETG